MRENARNLVELYAASCRAHAARPLFGTRTHGEWSWITYGAFGDLVDAARAGLAILGVGAGDRVAIIANNRVEWAAAAYATYGREAAFVPMYQAQRPADWRFILADSGARVVFAGSQSVYDALSVMRPDLPALERVIGLELPPGHRDSWAAFLAQGAAHPVALAYPPPSAVAGFVYTSGTTGRPKGALLTHGNIASNVAAVHGLFPIVPEDRTLSFLPWAHSFGQTCELHMVVSFGASTALNDELPRLLDNLAEIKPTILIAVPRIFNRIHELVTRQLAARSAPLQRLVHAGVRSAIKRQRGERLGLVERVELAVDDRLVFAKVRERFGGRVRFAISGSATLNREVAELIDALGIPVYEGYGLTETGPIVSSNAPGHRRMGTVGKVIPGVRVDIDTRLGHAPGEGEIVVHGPNVMAGYHDRAEETRAAFTGDGGLRTGDLGSLDADGFLSITGRIKEQYKLENGKYVMPAPLEEELKLSPYIANVMLYGDNRPYNVALVVLAQEAVRAWADEQGLPAGADLTRDPRVRALVWAELERLDAGFAGYEKPREIALLDADFTLENGLLTPTLKVRRREVAIRYRDTLEALYAAGVAAAPSAKSTRDASDATSTPPAP